MSAPVAARRVMVSGTYALWVVSNSGYASTVQVTGVLDADRADIGGLSLGFLASVAPNQDMAVRWPGLPRPSAAPAAPEQSVAAPGTVDYVRAHLAQGNMEIGVTMHTAGDVLAAIAYDPGWHAWVNGKPAPTQMLAPALTGVRLGPGHYRVLLRYEGYRWYPELWLAGLAGVLALAAADTALWRRWGRGPARSDESEDLVGVHGARG
jgi:hypothetical protein